MELWLWRHIFSCGECNYISINTERIGTRLKDVVTAHLYGLLDEDIYMKVLEGFKMPQIRNSSFRETY